MAKNFKRVKGTISNDWLKKFDGSPRNLLLDVMANPDLLSDEQGMYAERDFDAEESRKELLKAFINVIPRLTERQYQIVKTLQKYGTQEEAAKVLNISRSTVAMTLLQIRKKMSKLIDKERNSGQDIGD